ncbi:MAG: hypothetical protein ACP5P9_05165 [Acidimicrobiales bacterium]
MGVRRPEWVVAGAVLVCSPMLPGVLDGAVSTTTALERFLGALVVCWVAGALITSVLDRYADSVDRRQLERELARRTGVPPGHPVAGGPTSASGPSASPDNPTSASSAGGTAGDSNGSQTTAGSGSA